MADLRFRDCSLEGEFQQCQAARRRRVALQFNVFRCGCLLLMALRALERDVAGCSALLLGSATCLVPILALFDPTPAPRRRALQEAWLWASAAVDVVQASIGCLQHHHNSPSVEGIRPAASLVYLLGGSTVLWPHMYTAFTFLPFRVQFVSQAAVCQILLACNGRLCAASPGLLVGYRTVAALLGQAGGRRLQAAGRLLAAAARCAAGAAPAARAADGNDVQRCVTGQAAALLLLGFVGAMWLAYSAELRERQAFLAGRSDSCPDGRVPEEAWLLAGASSLYFFSDFAVPTLGTMCLHCYLLGGAG